LSSTGTTTTTTTTNNALSASDGDAFNEALRAAEVQKHISASKVAKSIEFAVDENNVTDYKMFQRGVVRHFGSKTATVLQIIVDVNAAARAAAAAISSAHNNTTTTPTTTTAAAAAAVANSATVAMDTRALLAAAVKPASPLPTIASMTESPLQVAVSDMQKTLSPVQIAQLMRRPASAATTSPKTPLKGPVTTKGPSLNREIMESPTVLREFAESLRSKTRQIRELTATVAARDSRIAALETALAKAKANTNDTHSEIEQLTSETRATLAALKERMSAATTASTGSTSVRSVNDASIGAEHATDRSLFGGVSLDDDDDDDAADDSADTGGGNAHWERRFEDASTMTTEECDAAVDAYQKGVQARRQGAATADVAVARTCFDKAAAAGHLLSLCAAGELCVTAAPLQPVRAAALLRRAARAGVAAAQSLLGLMYTTGSATAATDDVNGVPRDVPLGAALYAHARRTSRRSAHHIAAADLSPFERVAAADHANVDAFADVQIALLYAAGVGVAASEAKANASGDAGLPLLRQRADDGCARAQSLLACYHMLVDRNMQAAIQLWRRAAAAGNIDAVFSLACAHHHGHVSGSDGVATARRLYGCAADAGFARAAHVLATLDK
jgi:TPR repeat protein